jgi:hypothetical protein
MLCYSFCMYFCRDLKEHNLQLWMLNKYVLTFSVATPLLEECEDDTHTPEMGTWESSGTPKT